MKEEFLKSFEPQIARAESADRRKVIAMAEYSPVERHVALLDQLRSTMQALTEIPPEDLARLEHLGVLDTLWNTHVVARQKHQQVRMMRFRFRRSF